MRDSQRNRQFKQKLFSTLEINGVSTKKILPVVLDGISDKKLYSFLFLLHMVVKRLVSV